MKQDFIQISQDFKINNQLVSERCCNQCLKCSFSDNIEISKNLGANKNTVCQKCQDNMMLSSRF